MSSNVIDKRRFATEPSSERDLVARLLDDDYPPLTGIAEAFSPSSTPSDKPGMDFPTAIKQVMKGHRVTRLEWENPEIWLMMFYWGAINPEVPAGKYLSIHKANGAVHPLYIVDGDMLGDDWVVVV